VGLRVEHRGRRRVDLQGRDHQPPGMTFATRLPRRDDAPDAHRAVRLRENAQISQRFGRIATGGDPQVSGSGLGVAPVELLIGARLLDHEHVDPQLEQGVEHFRGQIGERLVMDGRHWEPFLGVFSPYSQRSLSHSLARPR
jgi:hypothetical protein